MEKSGTCLSGCSCLFIPPTVMIPPLEARHNENIFFYPFQIECYLNIYYNKLDYLFGANPKIPLAFC